MTPEQTKDFYLFLAVMALIIVALIWANNNDRSI